MRKRSSLNECMDGTLTVYHTNGRIDGVSLIQQLMPWQRSNLLVWASLYVDGII